MAIEDVLKAHVVRPVYLGFLDFKDDPIYGWTGNGNLAPSGTGDTDLDTNVFLSAEGVIELTPFVDNRELGGSITVTFAAADMATFPVVLQLIQDRRSFMGRKARFWRAFLNENENAILPEIQNLFNGVMVNAETTRQPGQGAIITVTCDQDLQKANVPPTRWIDHSLFYPTDTASTFINNLTRGSTLSVRDKLVPTVLPPNVPRWPRART